MVAPQIDRLLADIDTLATFTEPDTPGWTRRFPSAAYLAGRAWVRRQFEAAGLQVSVDAGGNLHGLRPGRRPLPAIFVGSHTDSVLGGGKYDGPLGVLGALEAARALAEAGRSLRHPLVVMDYLAEEANDFGVSCVGSRALSAGIQPAWFDRQHLGLTLAEALVQHGGSPNAARQRLLQPGDLHAALELHIEQGPVLESQSVAVAAVTGIVGIRRGMFELSGRADHAGTTPMTLRRDALAAAAEIIVGLETLARNTPGLVGTVGRLLVQPNQSNVVAETVTFVLEIRSLDVQQIAQGWDAVQALVEQACRARGVGHKLLAQTDTAPAIPPPWLAEAVLAACQTVDPRALRLSSGAGHDTSQLSVVAPAAMIFVPSAGGRSHTPAEYTAPEGLLAGVRALVEAILRVDQG